jgi:hypothetical protein
LRQRIPGKNPLFDRAPLNNLLFDKAFDAIFRHPGIPQAFGVDDQDGATLAYTEAFHFGAVACVGPDCEGEIPRFENVLQFRPSGATLVGRATAIADAQQDMSREFPDLQLLGDGCQAGVLAHFRSSLIGT